MYFVCSIACRRWVEAGAVAALACGALAGNPFAAEVVGYDAGVGAAPGFTDASTALGSATRFTGEALGFPSVVSPFSPPFGVDEIVSIGFGGSLTLRFDMPIVDAAANPFGVDFIVFGNAGFIDTNFPNGSVGSNPSMFGVGAAVFVEASMDGSTWFDVQTRQLDLMPTLGYLDSGPFDSVPGSVETNFRVATDPTVGLSDLAGLSYTELVDLYGRSGGGIGFDLSSSGLSEASYIRLSHAGLSGETFEIDAVSIVPAPATLSLVFFGCLSAARRRRASA
jgi:hypothetical protein